MGRNNETEEYFPALGTITKLLISEGRQKTDIDWGEIITVVFFGNKHSLVSVEYNIAYSILVFGTYKLSWENTI